MIGGLVVSTFVTLLIVPVLLEILRDLEAGWVRLRLPRAERAAGRSGSRVLPPNGR